MPRRRKSKFLHQIMPIILAIESSCDETAVAVLSAHEAKCEVLASEISSQISLHAPHGGVVPEIASRSHSHVIRPLVEHALLTAGIRTNEIDVVAATAGPGLASSLLVGHTVAKAMAAALGKPFVAVNHLEGHLLSPFLQEEEIPPHIALIISGGHTMLLHVAGAGQYRKIGSTRDDAAGEAFDKVAKMLSLPYPGGPHVERMARGGNPKAFSFPRGLLHESHFDFSFSGLKTSVLYTLPKLDDVEKALPDLCASFQEAVIDVLLQKSLRAVKEFGAKHLAISGGVSMNGTLRQAFQVACDKRKVKFSVSAPAFCTDNAAMIAFAAWVRYRAGHSDALDAPVHPNLPLLANL